MTISKHYPGPCKLVVDALPRNITYDRGGSAGVGVKYRSVSRLGLLIGNRWMPGLVVLKCANCSLHATVEGALSETLTTVSLSTETRCCLLLSGLRFASGEADVRESD